MQLCRWLLLLGLLVLTLQNSTCPENCTCTQGYTYECVKCLQTYYRYYDVNTQSCPCMTGFIEKDPQQSFCCPFNCSACTDQGCVRCPVNFMQKYSTYLEIYVCVCENNYYYNTATNSCLCLSQKNSSLYFEDIQNDNCYACPQNCSCNDSGCYSCTSPLRSTVRDATGKWTCPCKLPYENTDRECVCLAGCNCTSFTCLLSTNRQYKDGKFKCKHPYTEVNGTCSCTLPFMADKNNASNCVCSSRFEPTKYYSQGESCYRCVQGCICDQKGCIYCDPILNRQVVSYTCLCKTPYFLFNDSCNCTQPYYHSNNACVCLSNYNPLKYVYYQANSICYPCPLGCKCDATGCYQCGLGSLRAVKNFSGFYNCTCTDYTIDVNNYCKCQPYSELINGQCACWANQTVYDDAGKCRLCPEGCTCNPTSGCVSCNASSNRTPLANSTGYSRCSCNTGYSQNLANQCICTSPYYLDASGACKCPPPYIWVFGVCVCMSIADSMGYYYNNLDKMCIECPIGCNCNSTGCYSCQEYTLRYNVVANGFSDCPCIQNSSYINGYCTICYGNSYYYSGACVPCPTCLTCDIRGCTSCPNGSIWNSTAYTCTCSDPTMVNYNGTCRCGPGVYLNNVTNTCKSCPNNCLDCVTESTCTSCNENVNRYISPATNCPCVQGYIEMGVVQKYCCLDHCLSCNSTQCLSCPIFSYRVLVNGTCSCQNNLIEVVGSVVCGCPSRMYTFNGSCVVCPLNCFTCMYDQVGDRVVCLSCQPNMNRANNSSAGCYCMDRYKESNPVLDYCYPAYCTTPSRLCPQCESPRIVQNGGLTCGCKLGFFLNTYGDCLNCTMPGCLNCTALNLCMQCSATMGYYLTNYTCKSIIPPNDDQYLALQHQDGIYVVVRTGVNFTVYTEVLSVQAQLERIIERPIATDPIVEPVPLKVVSSQLIAPNVLQLHTSNPDVQLANNLLSISFVAISRNTTPISGSTWNGSDIHGSYVAAYETVYIYRNFTYSDSDLNVISDVYSMLTFSFTGLFTIVCIAMYILGFKHNQTAFFLQSLSFIGFTYNDPTLQIIPFLYNLRFSYYSFNRQLVWLLPPGYYETSNGNFSILSIDSNILRVGNITLLIALLVMILSVLLRVAQRILLIHNGKKRLLLFAKTVKKPVYRLLQFFYKTCMFPLLFLSVIALRNWYAIVLVGQASFRRLCQAVAIISICLYTLVTLFQLFGESISKLYRLENAVQFITSVLAAVIISYSPSVLVFLSLIGVYFIRAVSYILTRRYYLRDFHYLEYLRAGSFLLESLSLAVVMVNNRKALAALTFITVVYHIAHSVTVALLSYRRAQRSKRKSELVSSNNTELPISLQVESVARIDQIAEQDSSVVK